MAHLAASRLPALRKQHLLVEFAGLKQACPEGVFVSLTPDDPSMWSGVLFVRDGEYSIRERVAMSNYQDQLA